ncbi:MAG: hypothetical protein NVS3B10_15280 [Polyangiales bacterium]
MRREFPLFAVVVCALISPLGCGGSTSAGDPGTDIDSGTPGGGDTATGGDGISGDTATKTDSTSSGDTSTTTDTATADTSSGGDTAPVGDGGLTCGSTTCDPGQKCCATAGDGGGSFACAADCPDGAVALSCTGASTCGGATPFCCGTVTLTGTFPGCTFAAGEAKCATACNTEIPLTPTCSGTHKARLCEAKSECADDAANPECCTQGSSTQHICVPAAAKSFGASCL